MNNAQRAIVDDILYQEIKNLTKPFPIFLIGGARIGKTFTFICIIQNKLQHYTKNIINVDIFKSKVMKLTYTTKTTVNSNGTTIHFAFALFH